jgi:hypothetical protein
MGDSVDLDFHRIIGASGVRDHEVIGMLRRISPTIHMMCLLSAIV